VPGAGANYYYNQGQRLKIIEFVLAFDDKLLVPSK
jgi:hypothetical protein